ncbi:beta-N-acetylhexosaminidase, partial [Xanthomonas perforans]|nr:beta-N-acetylhexosaminidase [Xanthomonas perforans]
MPRCATVAPGPGVPNMLLIGVAGTELSAQERDWLQHDAVAGVVLF